jgi:hypothetical protein
VRGPEDLILSVKLNDIKGLSTLMIGEERGMIRGMPVLGGIDWESSCLQFLCIFFYGFDVGLIGPFYRKGTMLELGEVPLDIDDNHTSLFFFSCHGRGSQNHHLFIIL